MIVDENLRDGGATGIAVGNGKQSAFLSAVPEKDETTGQPGPFFETQVKGPDGAVQIYEATRKP